MPIVYGVQLIKNCVLFKLIKLFNVFLNRLVLIISILYLSGVHIKRQIHSYGGYTLDISG